VLANTVAFDRAEGETANITQTNMVCVSSFCGLQGLLLGHDLLIGDVRPHPLLGEERFCDAAPLFAATRALFGTVKDKRFPIAPGQHTLCAAKSFYSRGPCELYGALAVAIPEDRSVSADLFLEDHGTLPAVGDREQAKRCVLYRLADTVDQIGDNLGVTYCRIYLGIRSRRVAASEVGCALTAAPYILLARAAVPAGGVIELTRTPCAAWESTLQTA
jgi:histidine decarboxylase